MTIYVDKITRYPSDAMKDAQTRRNGPNWCHMWSDGPPGELIDFAVSLGLQAAWFQDHRILPHFDIVPSKRRLAIRYGAVEKSIREEIREQLGAPLLTN